MSDQESIDILNSLISKPGDLAGSKVTFSYPKKALNNIDENGDHFDGRNGGGCPFMNGSMSKASATHHTSQLKKNHEWQTSVSVVSEPVAYTDYLYLDKILDSQYPMSKKYGNEAHDEHLFIIVHQGN
jgi:hypothetical protein